MPGTQNVPNVPCEVGKTDPCEMISSRVDASNGVFPTNPLSEESEESLRIDGNSTLGEPMPPSNADSNVEDDDDLEYDSDHGLTTGNSILKWEENFHKLAAFKEKHGHCLVPNRYPEDPQLGSWGASRSVREDMPLLTVQSKDLTRVYLLWAYFFSCLTQCRPNGGSIRL
jgi:hypothetical protein